MNYSIGNRLFCDISPAVYVCQDNTSYTICENLTLLDCGDCGKLIVNNGLLLCDCGDSWNCKLCANDLPFSNMVNPGDALMFQFQQPDLMNGQNPNVPPVAPWGVFAKFKIFRCCDDTEIILDPDNQVALNKLIGLFEQKNYKGNSSYTNYQMIEFDVNAIIQAGFGGDFGTDNCFYFKFYFATDKAGEIFEEVCSEPYQLNSCFDSSVMLQGVYTNKDCFGYYYGAPVWFAGSLFQYENFYRVKGVLETDSFEIQKDLVTRQLLATNSQICDNFSLKTYGIPEAVAKLISNILAAKEVYIDAEIYQVTSSVEKNNDIGSHWYIDTKMKKCECYTDFSCI